MNRYIVIVSVILIMAFLFAFSGSRKVLDKAELGKLLFFDSILSKDNTISCASCHRPDFAFADTSEVSKGVLGRKGVRNAPTAMNVRLQKFFFWDGRAKTLEEQALAPIENPREMDLSLDEAISRLRNSKTYMQHFLDVFQCEPTRATLAEAIASYERTLETSDSPFDNWKFSDDSTEISDAARRGFEIFNGKGKCNRCHFGADFTANEFRNIGLFNGKTLNDSGRAIISGSMEDLGKFRAPTLRNVSITAPYMHNGIFKTLEEVIEFYNDPEKRVPDGINRDTILAKPMGLTCTEKADLEAFLMSLTDKQFANRK